MNAPDLAVPGARRAVGGDRAPADRRARAALLVACVAQFVLIVDDTIVNVALPSIGTGLGVASGDLSWVVNAYFLTFGGLLLVGGRVADRVGPRRVFVRSLVAPPPSPRRSAARQRARRSSSVPAAFRASPRAHRRHP